DGDADKVHALLDIELPRGRAAAPIAIRHVAELGLAREVRGDAILAVHIHVVAGDLGALWRRSGNDIQERRERAGQQCDAERGTLGHGDFLWVLSITNTTGVAAE